MNYISTRGTAPELAFDDVVLAGLARDGGLYLPKSWPVLSAEMIRAFKTKSFADIAKFGKKLDNKIYSIEPGNDGNRLIQGMIDKNQFGLGSFKMVESSEAGMLSQVQRAERRNNWVVFLGWEPHPMNSRFKMKYLEGGDDVFGPNLGGATIYTNVRKGYVQECANVGKLLTNLSFTLAMENSLMDAVLNQNKKPEQAATTWLKANSKMLDAWLVGVTSVDGKPAAAVVKAALAK